MRIKILFAVSFVVLGCAASFAQTSGGPPVPYVDRGACPFECCTYRRWKVVKPTAIRRAMNDSSPVISRLRTGQWVTGMTGVVITTQPGIFEATKQTTIDNVPVKPGDRVFVLTNLGEGFAKVWFKGRVREGEPYDLGIFKRIRDPKSVWWVKIKDRQGRIGWTREPENFDNIDQCG